jgi:DNA-directed RNA polymerase subunit RPC12/RpoP
LKHNLVKLTERVDSKRYRELIVNGMHKYVCRSCGNTYADSRGVNRHWNKHHPNEVPPPFESEIVPINNKQKKTTNEKLYYKIIQNGKTKYKCTKCGNLVSRLDGINRHWQRLHCYDLEKKFASNNPTISLVNTNKEVELSQSNRQRISFNFIERKMYHFTYEVFLVLAKNQIYVSVSM